MKIVIFGLTISSSWGNGHATIWRALCGGLARRGHTIVFFERDVPYYAAHRDLRDIPHGELCLFGDWDQIAGVVRRHLSDADVAIVTSYCADARAASDLLFESSIPLRVFYDLDAPVTLARLAGGEEIEYLGSRGLRDFDLVLSYTGGRTLDSLKEALGARRVAPLYGCVDPEAHRPVAPVPRFMCDLSYLGTYAADRQAALNALFLEPARRMPHHRFYIGGSQYPPQFPWASNIHYVPHMPPQEHPPFFCSSRMTLNVTRQAMADMGYCPSGRLFEAASCGTPILSDWWEGLQTIFQPQREILIVREGEDVVRAIETSDRELREMAAAARDRVLREHTADHRAVEMEARLTEAASCFQAARQPVVSGMEA